MKYYKFQHFIRIFAIVLLVAAGLVVIEGEHYLFAESCINGHIRWCGSSTPGMSQESGTPTCCPSGTRRQVCAGGEWSACVAFRSCVAALPGPVCAPGALMSCEPSAQYPAYDPLNSCPWVKVCQNNGTWAANCYRNTADGNC